MSNGRKTRMSGQELEQLRRDWRRAEILTSLLLDSPDGNLPASDPPSAGVARDGHEEFPVRWSEKALEAVHPLPGLPQPSFEDIARWYQESADASNA